MEIKGADYAWTHPSVSTLKTAGIKFVCRYLSRDPSKNLTHAEADALLAAGIAVVAVWEWDARDMLRGHDGGVEDAQAADLQTRACGLPGIPVYFACDYDAPGNDQKTINAYLDGAASVIGRERTGMYGGYWPLTRARQAAKAKYWWGTPAWSGANWASSWTPHIMQNGIVPIGGASCDINWANRTDYGQWPRPQGDDVSATGPASWDAADWKAFFGRGYNASGWTLGGTLQEMKGTTLPGIAAAVAAVSAKVDAEVDEAAIAAALIPVIQSAITQVAGDADAEVIAQAVAAVFAGKLGA